MTAENEPLERKKTRKGKVKVKHNDTKTCDALSRASREECGRSRRPTSWALGRPASPLDSKAMGKADRDESGTRLGALGDSEERKERASGTRRVSSAAAAFSHPLPQIAKSLE